MATSPGMPYFRHPERGNCKRNGIVSAAVQRRISGWRRSASVSRNGLAQRLFSLGRVSFSLSRNQLVSVFPWPGKYLRERHQIRVFIERDFRSMNCRVGWNGLRFHLRGRAAAWVAEFQRQFGGAGNFANHEVAFWKGCISNHEWARHPENNLGADLRADGKCADGHRHQDVEREFPASGFMKSPCGLNVHARIFLLRRDVHSKNQRTGDAP